MKDPRIPAEIEIQKERIREATEYDARAAIMELDEALETAQLTKDAKTVNSVITSRMALAGLIVE